MTTFTTQIVNGLLYLVATDQDSYRRGGSVQVTFVKVNTSSRNITLNYNSSQRFDIVVLRANREVFRFSRGRTFARVAGRVVLGPGQLQAFRFIWDQRDNAGNLVTAGSYSICAENVATAFAGRTVCVPIRIAAGVTPGPPPTPSPPTPSPPTPGPCPPGNLINDPGIEQWVTQSQPRIWSGTNVLRTTTSRTGRFAAEMGAVHNRSASLFQAIRNAPGGVRYRMAFWVRENVHRRRVANYTLMAEMLFFDNIGRVVDRADIRLVARDISSSQYRRFTQTTPVINRAATNARVQFIFVPASNNDNTVLIDDVEVNCIR